MLAETDLAARPAPGNGSPASNDSGMYRAERWRGKGGEHARMLGQRIGHALAARQPSSDELVGVSPVRLRARRAH